MLGWPLLTPFLYGWSGLSGLKLLRSISQPSDPKGSAIPLPRPTDVFSEGAGLVQREDFEHPQRTGR